MEKLYKKLTNNSKKIKMKCIILLIAIIIIIAIYGICYLMYVKYNINYTESQAENIALNFIDGAILRREKEVDDGILEYEFNIMDKNNVVREVTVSSKTGGIINSD